MPKIHTLETDSTITSTDKLLGSDGAVGANNATKNYTVGALKTFMFADADLNTFKTISVSGQDNVVADADADTLTLAAGSNVTITTNASTDTITFASTDTDTTYTAGDGLDLTSTEFAVDTTVVRTSGAQTIAGVKTFSDTISGSIDGNAATVTNGVYTTGDQTIYGTKTFDATISGDISGNAATVTNGVYTTGDQTIGGLKTFSSEIVAPSYAFSTTFGKIKEAKVTITSANLIALTGGGNYTLLSAIGANKAIIPISITIQSDPGATPFNFNEDLYIGHENEVSSTTTDYFVSIGASFINATTIAWRHFPFAKAANEYVDIRTNDALVLHATSTATVTAGNGELLVNIVYREVDFT